MLTYSINFLYQTNFTSMRVIQGSLSLSLGLLRVDWQPIEFEWGLIEGLLKIIQLHSGRFLGFYDRSPNYGSPPARSRAYVRQLCVLCLDKQSRYAQRQLALRLLPNGDLHKRGQIDIWVKQSIMEAHWDYEWSLFMNCVWIWYGNVLNLQVP